MKKRNRLYHHLQQRPLTQAIPLRTDTLGFASRTCFHSGSCFRSASGPIVPRHSPVTPNICIWEEISSGGYRTHAHLRKTSTGTKLKGAELESLEVVLAVK